MSIVSIPKRYYKVISIATDQGNVVCFNKGEIMSKMAYRNKNTLWVFLLSTAVLYTQLPTISPFPKAGFSLPQRYRFTTPYGFALMNSASYPIWVTLENNNQILLLDFLIESSNADDLKGVMVKISLDKPTKLTIFAENKGLQSYKFPVGKTMYLVFDTDGVLRPQIGKMYGLKPESKAGFVLTRNLQPGDINRF
jgi:predicted nucleic acid-binding Zn ribbon protein